MVPMAAARVWLRSNWTANGVTSTSRIRLVIPFQYAAAASFSEGLAAVQVEDKWGFLRKNGSVAIRPEWDKSGEFSEGVCPVRKNKLWGWINPAGSVVAEPAYSELNSFADGFAAATRGNQSLYIDHSDRVLWKQTMECPVGSPNGRYTKPS